MPKVRVVLRIYLSIRYVLNVQKEGAVSTPIIHRFVVLMLALMHLLCFSRSIFAYTKMTDNRNQKKKKDQDNALRLALSMTHMHNI
ncbi:uncharacterized protein BO87DRAFT_180314 [Aspergillus neoniger CBS 115656]|uniref:Uncharacterized protein n=2 Tax=Aspergillus subgen. Circumdati TaxID=2720871 RepID=A0A1L9N9L2_ASPTC|nr:hypothetical protein BO87DRAFT_180314 [Aspergillus neoniger CBS 115656]OJI85852.1 hypothetical protein ASPTUDRAFT_600134 [Aspergillus tubingensis CBS 134.48]PYH29504.1 hypothetical protein BO87DRAFT_180314 [Aspergillus neoniger CBS 115656]